MSLKRKKDQIEKTDLKNIVSLVQTFEKRMDEALASLKDLNDMKKKHDRASALFGQKIKGAAPKIEKAVSELELDMLAFFEWARKQENNPCIQVHDQAFSGTVFKGVYSSLSIEKRMNRFSVVEKQDSAGNYSLVLEGD